MALWMLSLRRTTLAPRAMFVCLLLTVAAVPPADPFNSNSDTCPVECTCSRDESLQVQCENQELTSVPNIPVQAFDLGLAGNIIELDDSAFNSLSQLNRLDLSSNRIAALNIAALRPLRSLRALNLSENLLLATGSLPEGALLPLARTLEDLDLSGNGGEASGVMTVSLGSAVRPLTALRSLRACRANLRDIAALASDIAQYNQNLVELVVDGNNFGTLDALSFRALGRQPRLQRLSIADSRVRHVMSGTFDHLRALTELNLSGNQIALLDLRRTLTELGGLAALKRLAVARANISRFDGGSGLFDNSAAGVVSLARRLSSLDLAGNMLADLGNRRFIEMAMLQDLNLNDNLIVSLSEGTFSGLVSLTKLSLAGNRLRRLTTVMFESLSQLKSLDLSRNQFSVLDPAVFSDLFDLAILDLSQNRIDAVLSGNGGGLEALEQLSVAGNRLPSLDHLSRLPFLRVLDASRNRLTVLPANFAPEHGSLVLLNLSDNTIADVDPTAFAGRLLRSIDLSGNRLTRLPRCSGCMFLERLLLRGNGATSVANGAFASLSHLNELDIGDNDLNMLANDVFAGTVRLRKLRLDSNSLAAFVTGDNAAAALSGGRSDSSLEELDLSHNGIWTLRSSLFTNLTRLRSLDLSGNRLRELTTRQVDGLTVSLISLNLSSNELSSALSPATIARLSVLFTLDLSSNPFDCNDCAVESFRRWATTAGDTANLDRKRLRVAGYRTPGRYTCAADETQMHTLPLSANCESPLSSDSDGLSGTDEKTIILAVIGCTAFVVLVVAAAVFWQHRVRLRRKLHKQQHYHAIYDRASGVTTLSDKDVHPNKGRTPPLLRPDPLLQPVWAAPPMGAPMPAQRLPAIGGRQGQDYV